MHLRDLFSQDPERGEPMTLEACDLYLDYSKNRLTDETMQLLFNLTDRVNLRQQIDDMCQRLLCTEMAV